MSYPFSSSAGPSSTSSMVVPTELPAECLTGVAADVVDMRRAMMPGPAPIPNTTAEGAI